MKLENYDSPGRQRREPRSILHDQLAHLHTGNAQKKVSNIAYVCYFMEFKRH